MTDYKDEKPKTEKVSNFIINIKNGNKYENNVEWTRIFRTSFQLFKIQF